MKVGDEKEQRSKQIYVFHNSWRVRAPLLSDGMTGTIHHWNNAIVFTGCGPKGSEDCRVSGEPDPDCGALGEYFTWGKQSIVFSCVDKARVVDPASYDYRYDISNQVLPVELTGEPRPSAGKDGFKLELEKPEEGDFRLRDGSDLIGAGCRVVPRPGGALACEPGEPRIDVGAFSANGIRYSGRDLLN
jgi:hypothetical protein